MRIILIRQALRQLMETQEYYTLTPAARLHAVYKLIFEAEQKCPIE